MKDIALKQLSYKVVCPIHKSIMYTYNITNLEKNQEQIFKIKKGKENEENTNLFPLTIPIWSEDKEEEKRQIKQI